MQNVVGIGGRDEEQHVAVCKDDPHHANNSEIQMDYEEFHFYTRIAKNTACKNLWLSI